MLHAIQTNWKCFIKYSIIGCTGTIIDVGGFTLLLSFTPLNTFIAAALSFVVAVSSNFVWNKIWTFQDRQKLIKRQYAKYLLVSVGGLTLNLFFLWIFIMIIASLLGVADDKLPILGSVIAKLAAIAIVGIYNYAMNKLWTFRRACKAPPHPYPHS